MASDTVERDRMTLKDSRGKVLRKAKKDNEQELVNLRWWNCEEGEMAGAIAATINFIHTHQGDRMTSLKDYTWLAGGPNAMNLMGSGLHRARPSTGPGASNSRMSYNLISSVIATLQSKMAKNKVLPSFLTTGGGWDAQKKAKDLTKFIQGLFYKENVHAKTIQAWTDCAVWGDGFLQIYDKDDQVCIERAFTHQLFVDSIETAEGSPKQLHRIKLMDRDVAKELFPELEEFIEKVSTAGFDLVGGLGTAVDLIVVTESWHLKSGPDAKDGLHVFSIGEGAIAEDYEKDYFPFAHLRYWTPQFGWYGQGVAERLSNIQRELNRNLILKQKALYMQSSFKILCDVTSKIVDSHLNNDCGTIIKYSGIKPEYITPPATNPELQQWIDMLINYGYQQEGISRMATTGEAPLGVESGKAMRTLMQVSDDRFLYMQQEMEAFTLEVGRQSIEIVKEISGRKGGKYECIYPDKRFLETVDWADIDLDDEQYVLRAYPTSSLSEDLAGRLSEVQELTQGGYISLRTSRRLLDFPDTAADDSLANSSEDRLHQIFENMLNKGEWTAFEAPFHDAALAQPLALKYINLAEYLGAPEDNIQLIRSFIEQINASAMSLQAAMGPAPGAPQMNPGMGAAQPGVSPAPPPEMGNGMPIQ